MTEQSYTYVLLRYRHDPLAGEFVNVGVVLHSSGASFLGARVRHTLGRMTKIFSDLDGEAFKAALRSIESQVRKMARTEGGDILAKTNNAVSFAKRALPADDSSFVWGPLGSGIATDPEETLESLYARFVGRYDEAQKARRDDAAIWRPLRERLAARNLADRLQAKEIISPVDQVEFMHAWKNGSWHCYQPLSFDLASDENIKEKAKRWAGQLLALSDATEAFKPYFLVGAPQDARLMPSYRNALEILQRGPCHPKVVEEADFEVLARQIEDEILASDASYPGR
jgi:hypothetical protein